MPELIFWWQHLPNSLHPVAFTFGNLRVYWYALFFLLGAGTIYLFLKTYNQKSKILVDKQFEDFAFGVFLSALIGGKIGFLFFYWLPFTESSNTRFSPLSLTDGLALPGMSFVGGVVAVSLFVYWFAKKNEKNLFALTDALVLFLPLGIFFGRLGNFFHVELLGRVTQVSWGMYFPGETSLRHPSTLYAAFLEGGLLFLILFFNKKKNVLLERPGVISAYFFIFYGILRFLSECFREPDAQIGFIGFLTLNQIFAALFLCIGIVIFSIQKEKN